MPRTVATYRGAEEVRTQEVRENLERNPKEKKCKVRNGYGRPRSPKGKNRKSETREKKRGRNKVRLRRAGKRASGEMLLRAMRAEKKPTAVAVSSREELARRPSGSMEVLFGQRGTRDGGERLSMERKEIKDCLQMATVKR